MAFVSCSEDANRISGLWELDHAEDLFRDKLLNRTETAADAVQETLRLDVDGPYPQMAASGAWKHPQLYLHWTAKLAAIGPSAWEGQIIFKDGDTSQFPYTTVNIALEAAPSNLLQVIFSNGSSFTHTSYYRWASPYFHPVQFEFDSEAGVTPVLAIDTHAHPNHPATLPNEQLTIENVFRRAGFDVSISAGANSIPISEAGLDVRWSDAEMHDAMQRHWSQFANEPKWALWVFFASLYEEGASVGGIMFDSIGPQHRQGTAIFNRSFISVPAEGESHPEAWVERMKFWTACHEMGHGFNLAHSWQKALGEPWIPLRNEGEARSFMNYPYSVRGGETAFFANFEYRFSDNELLFMRHAPERFVQMGNAEWFDHHGFEQHRLLAKPTFELLLRANRETLRFEFMEPVVLELKLTNRTSEPQIIDRHILTDLDHMTIIVKKQGKTARKISPFVHYLQKPEHEVLAAGQSVYNSLFIAVGKNGWEVSEPGDYTIQVALHCKHEDIVSNPLTVRVEPPMDRTEEFLAQDFFTEATAKTIYFDGTKYAENSNGVLEAITERLPHRKVAIHAQVALAMPMTKPYKLLGQDGRIHIIPPAVEQARKTLAPSLLENSHLAANTLGHIDYRHYMDRLSESVATRAGDPQAAAEIQSKLLQTLADRQVRQDVLADIKDKEEDYRSMRV
ncbi:hypothetical protein [Paenibacillus sp. TH7-28]